MADSATRLMDENGLAITANNPLPTTGGGSTDLTPVVTRLDAIIVLLTAGNVLLTAVSAKLTAMQASLTDGTQLTVISDFNNPSMKAQVIAGNRLKVITTP